MVFFFLLPWQTRWIFGQAEIVGQPFQFGVMSLYATQVLLVAIFLLSLLPGKKGETRDLRRTKGFTFFLLGAAIISVFFASNYDVAWTQVMHLGFAGMLLFVLFDSRVKLDLVMKSFVAGLFLPALLGLWQFINGGSAASTLLGLAVRDAQTLGDAVTIVGDDRVLRAYGSFPHPNIFGGFLAVALLSIVALWQKASTPYDKSMLGLFAIASAMGLAITLSRSAWLGFVVGIIAGSAVLYYHGRKGTAQHANKIAALIVFVILLVTVGLVSGRFDPSSQIESASLTERVEQYQDFPSVMHGSAWIFGNGIGNYTLALADADPSREWWQYQPIHNVPLLIIGEIGLLGFLLTVLFAGSIDIMNFRRFPNTDAVIAFVMGNIILVVAFIDHYLWSSWAGLALVAYVMALTARMGETTKYGKQ